MNTTFVAHSAQARAASFLH